MSPAVSKACLKAQAQSTTHHIPNNRERGPFNSLVQKKSSASEPTNRYEGKYTKHLLILITPIRSQVLHTSDS